MKIKNKLIITTFILAIFLVLFPTFVLSECPKTIYSLNELRSDLRTITFGFLANPALSPYTKNEILDLLDFYKTQKGKSLVDNCDVVGINSGELISAIMAKIIVFQKECSDGIDNDGDGAIDLSDAACTDLSDNDETNCGDKICEGGETCSSCSYDCCFLPGIGILFMKNVAQNAISFKDSGDVILKGTLSKLNPNPQVTPDDEFILKDSAGNSIAVINLVTGNMIIKGNLFEKQAALTPSPSSNDFIIKDLDGNVVSYIDDTGNFYLKGNLIQKGSP